LYAKYFVQSSNRDDPRSLFLVITYREIRYIHVGFQMGKDTPEKTDVLQGTLVLIVLRTLEALGPLHGYGIACRIEQISLDLLQLNQGTLYPVMSGNWIYLNSLQLIGVEASWR
jgi:hypothetical protein